MQLCSLFSFKLMVSHGVGSSEGGASVVLSVAAAVGSIAACIAQRLLYLCVCEWPSAVHVCSCSRVRVPETRSGSLQLEWSGSSHNHTLCYQMRPIIMLLCSGISEMYANIRMD